MEELQVLSRKADPRKEVQHHPLLHEDLTELVEGQLATPVCAVPRLQTVENGTHHHIVVALGHNDEAHVGVNVIPNRLISALTRTNNWKAIALRVQWRPIVDAQLFEHRGRKGA